MKSRKRITIAYIFIALSIELALISTVHFYLKYNVIDNSLIGFLLFICLPVLFGGGFLIFLKISREVKPTNEGFIDIIKGLRARFSKRKNPVESGNEHVYQTNIIPLHDNKAAEKKSVESSSEFKSREESFNGVINQYKVCNKQLEEDKQSLVFLHNINQSISSSLDVHKVLDNFSDAILSYMENSNCRVALFDKDKENLVIEVDKYASYCAGDYSQEGMEFSTQYLNYTPKLMSGEPVKLLSDKEFNGELSAYERELLFPNQIKTALLVNINSNDGKAMGLTIIGDRRDIDRAAFTQEKIGFCSTMVNQAIPSIENARFHRESQKLYLSSIIALAEALDARDSYTLDHSKMVSYYSFLLGKAIGLDNKELEIIRNAGLLHDIGKIAIPDKILHKPGKLTNEEFVHIEEHPRRGAKILSPVKDFHKLIPIVAHHHESYDGNGYNDHLKGEEIPLGARIMAVADAFHAMTSDRPYRLGMSVNVAIDKLIECRGSQFDPRLVDVFVKLMNESQLKPSQRLRTPPNTDQGKIVAIGV